MLGGTVLWPRPHKPLCNHLQKWALPSSAHQAGYAVHVIGDARADGAGALRDKLHPMDNIDLQILRRTLALVLRRTGVSANGEATMPVFQGNG